MCRCFVHTYMFCKCFVDTDILCRCLWIQLCRCFIDAGILCRYFVGDEIESQDILLLTCRVVKVSKWKQNYEHINLKQMNIFYSFTVGRCQLIFLYTRYLRSLSADILVQSSPIGHCQLIFLYSHYHRSLLADILVQPLP